MTVKASNKKIKTRVTIVGAKKKGNTSVINTNKPKQNAPRALVKMRYTDGQGNDKIAKNVPEMLQRVNRNVSLSECAAKYASAIANPWSPLAANACVPYGESRMSQKTTSFARFDAVVGTNGVGYAMFSPTICNDLATCYYTTAAFTGTTSAAVASGTGTVSTVGVNVGLMANLPYGLGNLVNSLAPTPGGLYNRGRIISYGVSASYTGTELNMGGLMYCLTDPNHNNLAFLTVALVGNRLETDVANVSRDKCWLMSSAIDTEELEYSGNTINASDALATYYPFSRNAYLDAASVAGSYNNGACPMLILFTGTPGNTVHIEIVQHTEYIGPITEGKTSPSTLDAQGTFKVLAAANRVPVMKINNPSKSYGKLFYQALEHTTKELLPVAVTALKAMLI